MLSRMVFRRLPGPRLSPFIKILWASDPAASPASVAVDRERVLPTGAMHLVFRLSDHPLRLFNDINDPFGYRVGHTIVGGARAAFYVREISGPACSVGAQLHPGRPSCCLACRPASSPAAILLSRISGVRLQLKRGNG